MLLLRLRRRVHLLLRFLLRMPASFLLFDAVHHLFLLALRREAEGLLL